MADKRILAASLAVCITVRKNENSLLFHEIKGPGLTGFFILLKIIAKLYREG
jgi:hypothetical protein